MPPTSQHVDSLLVQQAQQGDRTAFDTLVRQYRAILVQDAWSRAGSLDVAEDVVQEALHRAWHRLASLRDPAALVPWLRAIVLNTYRKWLQRRHQAEELTDELADVADVGSNPDTFLLTRETSSVVMQALENLPLENRQALLLASIHELPYTDIAALLGIPVTTVEGRIQRARQQLRRTLGADWQSSRTAAQPPSTIPYRTNVMPSDPQVLLRQAREGMADERREAVIYLGHLRVREAVSALVALLDDADESLQAQAAFALGRIRDPEAVISLLTVCGRPLGSAGVAARKALRLYPSRVIEAPLLRAMTDAHDDLRRQAIAFSIHCVTSRVTAALMQMLQDDHLHQRMSALTALGAHLPRSRKEQITPVLRCLDDPSVLVRAAALRLLGTTHPRLPEVQVGIHAAVFDPSDVLRAAAYAVVGMQNNQTTDPLVVEAICASVEQDTLLCRIAAIQVLGRLHLPDTVDRLRSLLDDQVQLIREAAVTALGALGDDAVISDLLLRLVRLTQDASDPHAGLVSHLRQALHAFGHRAESAWRDALGAHQPLPLRRAAMLELTAFPEFDLTVDASAALRDDDHALRVAALQVLGRRLPDEVVSQLNAQLLPWFTRFEIPPACDHPDVVPHLLPCLLDPSPAIREAAVHALSVHGDARAVEPLLALLVQETDDERRRDIVLALGTVGDARVAPVFQQLLQEGNGEFRQRILEALASLRDGSGLPVLIKVFQQDPSPPVRDRAIRWCTHLRELSPVKPLIKVLQRDANDVAREMAAWVLGFLGDARAVEALIATLHDPVEWTRSAACVALGALGDRRAIEPLRQGLRESPESPLYGIRDRFRARCCLGLSFLGDTRCHADLRQLVRKSDIYIRSILEDTLTGSIDLSSRPILEELADDLMIVDGSRRLRSLPALLALTELGDRQAAESLVHYLAGDPDGAVTPAPWWMVILKRADHDVPCQVIRTLVRAGARHVMPLVMAYLEPQLAANRLTVTGVTLAELLTRCSDPRGLRVITQALACEQQAVRVRALIACTDGFPVEPPALTASFATLTRHSDPITRVLAARNLVLRDDHRGLAPLVDAYSAEAPVIVRRLAAVALGAITAPGVRQALGESAVIATVRRDLQSPVIADRVGALLVLAVCYTPEHAAALRKTLQDPSSRVREAALAAAGRSGDSALIPALKRLLTDPSPRLRLATLHALGALGDSQVVPAILTMMKSETVTPVVDGAISVLQQLSHRQ